MWDQHGKTPLSTRGRSDPVPAPPPARGAGGSDRGLDRVLAGWLGQGQDLLPRDGEESHSSAAQEAGKSRSADLMPAPKDLTSEGQHRTNMTHVQHQQSASPSRKDRFRPRRRLYEIDRGP